MAILGIYVRFLGCICLDFLLKNPNHFPSTHRCEMLFDLDSLKPNIAPENKAFPKGNGLVFQPSIFRCENVSFRECFFSQKTPPGRFAAKKLTGIFALPPLEAERRGQPAFNSLLFETVYAHSEVPWVCRCSTAMFAPENRLFGSRKDRNSSLQPSLFRGYVSFKEAMVRDACYII